MRIRLKTLRELSLGRPGMMTDFTHAGAIKGADLEISREAFDRLQAKWFPGVKLGTIVHEVIKPAVRVIDAALGTNLANCGGCAEREMKLNQLGKTIGIK